MAKTAIVTDSNSGITQREGKEAGIFVLPMPFLINDTSYFEDINLTQEEFYVHLRDAAANVSTSQPSIGDLLDFWNDILKEYDEIVHIPMSSGLSQSCAGQRFWRKNTRRQQPAHFGDAEGERFRRAQIERPRQNRG